MSYNVNHRDSGGGGGPGGGGHFHWRPYQMLEEKKTRKKGIQIRGGRGTRGSRKGCQNREKWGKGYPNCDDQRSSRGIKPGKGR